MQTNWKEIALTIGAIEHENSSEELTSTALAKSALEEILGEEWIHQTVDFAITGQQGSELAVSCLRHISSSKAAEYAYGLYSDPSMTKDQQFMAVWLIKELAVVESYDWIETFLNDANVLNCGLGVLDQLLWRGIIHYDENKPQVDHLLQLAVKNSNNEEKEFVEFIQGYLKEFEEDNIHEALMDAISLFNYDLVMECLDYGANPNYIREYTAEELEAGTQPSTPLGLVMFRISDNMLEEEDLLQFKKIAALLINAGADSTQAMKLAEERYGKYDPNAASTPFMDVWHTVAGKTQ